MARAALDAQRALAASGLPVVLSGTAYPSVRGLVWMNTDQRQVGRLLAEYLLGKGARQIAVLMRDRMQQGDHIVLDTVRDTLAEAGLPLTALTLRCLPSDAEAAAAEVGLLLDAQPGPVGLLCRSTPLADAARSAIESRGFRPGKCPVIAVCDVYGAKQPIYAHARPVIGPQEWGAPGRTIARLPGPRRTPRPGPRIGSR